MYHIFMLLILRDRDYSIKWKRNKNGSNNDNK